MPGIQQALLMVSGGSAPPSSSFESWVDGQPIALTVDTTGSFANWTDGQPQIQEHVT